MYKLCLSMIVAVAVTVPSIANAGGGDTKKNGKLSFINQSGQTAFVIVDPSDALLQELQAGNFNNFIAQGGRILTNPNETTTFDNLRSGNHRWATALTLNNGPPGAGDFSGIANVRIDGGKTKLVRLLTP